jgi:hypothetical protein
LRKIKKQTHEIPPLDFCKPRLLQKTVCVPLFSHAAARAASISFFTKSSVSLLRLASRICPEFSGLDILTFLFDWGAGIRAPTWVEMDEKVLMDDLLDFLFK